MKKYLLVLVSLTPVFLNAQTTVADSNAIKQTCLDYVEGFYNADTARVAKAIHPELVKRIIMKNFQNKLNTINAQSLVKAAKLFTHPPDPSPDELFCADIRVFDIEQGIASVKVKTNKMKFFDYIQLGKINGDWKIINVLWAFTN